MEVAGLGDNVHLLPALWLARRTYPDAQLHVLAASGAASLFKLTPWVDRVWSYPWNPRPSMLEQLRWGMTLRAQRYDLVINFSGSDRTTLLAGMSGAPQRWGRRPHDGGMIGFGMFYTRVLEQPFYTRPMFMQKFDCLAAQGFSGCTAPEFHIELAAPAETGYIHVSPCTTAPRRELPLAQLAELLNTLSREFPERRLVLSCAPEPRERERLAALLPLLAVPPWQVHAGTLDIPGLASLIKGAALHLCGDTGALHLALMTGTPAVAWFRKHAHDAEREWIPPGPRYRVRVSNEGSEEALGGISTGALLDDARELLRAAT
jgi:ADP-heptose:LPS heptosyltransferase